MVFSAKKSLFHFVSQVPIYPVICKYLHFHCLSFILMTRPLICSSQILCPMQKPESKAKKKRCKLFKHTPLTKEEMMAFIGSLIPLGIHAVRNYRKAWSESKAQVLIRLHDLMSCQRFELIGSFLHIVTMDHCKRMRWEMIHCERYAHSISISKISVACSTSHSRIRASKGW